MNSIILRAATHIVSGLMLVFSAFLLLRGHHEPGGGFIGALIAVIAFALLMMSESPSYVFDRLRFHPAYYATGGIMIAIISGLLPYIAGLPFLTGLWWKDILPLGTPLLFDLGVYFAVLGGVLNILLQIDRACQ